MTKIKINKNLIYFIILIVIFIAGISLIIIKSPFYKNDGIIEKTGKIAVIPIKGTISTENGDGSLLRGGTVGSGTIVSFIEKAAMDESIDGILLNINSPGGTVVASKEIADAIKRVDKPVVALIREVGASGAYWVASAADYIVADPLSVTGSIGVIGSYLEFSELFSDYGIGYQEITTGKYKDLGSPFKSLKEEERNVLVKKLQIIHDYFIEDVSKNRGIDLKEYGNGLFYLGKEAKDIGLIDELGGKDEAIASVKRLTGIKKHELVFYQKKTTILDILSRISENFGFSVGQGFGSKVLEQNDFEIKLK